MQDVPVNFFLDGKVELRPGDCREVIKAMPDASVDSVVTDPPYALVSISDRYGRSSMHEPVGTKPHGSPQYQRLAKGFMGKDWDNGETAFAAEFWSEVLRVLKPGGHVVAFSGTRTYHRMAVAIEDAGFEIRDQLAWVYGSGFPKSHDVSKGIDKAAGAVREKVRDTNPRNPKATGGGRDGTEGATRPWIEKAMELGYHEKDGNEPATALAKQWQGWGTALKPSFEPVLLGRKPLTEEMERNIISGNLYKLGARSWLMLCASHAKENLPLNLAEQKEALNTAQWSVENAISTWEDLFDQMDTLPSRSAATTLWNTVSSWLNTWDELLKLTNTSTIETVLNTTIDWKIWSYCSSAITLESIIPDLIFPSGESVNAGIAARYLSVEFTRLNAILERSALENVIASQVDNSLGVGGDILVENICLARKPLTGTVAANVLEHGTGALNIDGCRVATDESLNGGAYSDGNKRAEDASSYVTGVKAGEFVQPTGRWPANIVHDGSDEVLEGFPDSNSTRSEVTSKPGSVYGGGAGLPSHTGIYDFDDSGSAARFFYTAKADAIDRLGSKHPTVKPVDLMQWLVRLVTPKGGLVLDPFAGSGSTGEAAWREGMRCVLIEREEEYQRDIRKRMSLAFSSNETRWRESNLRKMAPRKDDIFK